jgi:hypothetical protein
MSPTIASCTTKRDLTERRRSAARCNADGTALWLGLISLDAALSSEARLALGVRAVVAMKLDGSGLRRDR